MDIGRKAYATDWDARLAAAIAVAGLLEPEGLKAAREMAAQRGLPLHRVLIDHGQIDEELLLPLVCAELDIRFEEGRAGAGTRPDVDTIARLSAKYLTDRAAVPLEVDGAETQVVLLSDPADAELRQEIAFHLGREVEIRGATRRTIRQLLSQVREEDTAAGRRIQRLDTAEEPPEAEGPVIRFVNDKLADAIALGASDLHFEAAGNTLTVRLRINGVLVKQDVQSELSPAAVLARLKVMASANVSERRLPQDARLTLPMAGRVIDFRFSSLPTQSGESIVLRVLDPYALKIGWDALGFEEDIARGIRRAIERPNGLFLVTGPTGSGKTTTLYTAVAHLNTPKTKIVTVEDPVEYNLDGIQQVQVQEAIGLSFARVLRAVLRQDPNVILIGEIRDPETAEIACRAAQVGRMVLSTLHTNSAEGAALRLEDLGVPRYMVSDVLRGVLSQRLVAQPCPACAGGGCASCNFTGAAGRRLETQLLEFGVSPRP